MTRVVAGVDIGGTNIRIGLVSMEYELLEFVILPSERMLLRDSPLDIITEEIHELLGRGSYELAAVSIGIPSLINNSGNGPISSPNLKFLDNCDLVTPLRKSIFCDVFLNKDSNLLMLHEITVNNINGDETVIGVFFGTGIGNGVWVHGKLLQGKNSAACELGHIPVWRSEARCACGNKGCIECIASGKRLEAICAEVFPGTDIGDVFAEHWPHPVLKEFVESMSLPVATEINIFNPDYVILGGGIIYMDQFPMETLLEEIKKKVRKPMPAENIRILFSKCKQETGVLGAAMYAVNKLNNQIVKPVPNKGGNKL